MQVAARDQKQTEALQEAERRVSELKQEIKAKEGQCAHLAETLDKLKQPISDSALGASEGDHKERLMEKLQCAHKEVR